MPVPPPRLAAALADRYRLERELGQGGMATVYLAQDLKHDRRVAVKVLKPELAAVLGAERFVVEIKTTAALQHPHILPLFDSGEADGFLYYVMPFIDGETLRAKLDRETQLSVDEAVRLTTDVADALQYAHEQGVIHRDIKPENILLANGRPMVADFGIALAVSAAAGGRMTETGLSLGTPHYMSPEQATAEKEITARSDVYSLASVCYEMLAGQPPHLGGSAQAIIMKIIAEPVQPVTALRRSVPPNVAAALAQALEKVPADRFASARAFAAALANPAFATAAWTQAAVPPAIVQRARLVGPLLVVAVLAIAAAAWGWLRGDPPATEVVRASLTGLDMNLEIRRGWRLAITRDGRYVVAGDGGRTLHVRAADSVAWRQLPNTEGATNPTFSPDGRFVAFNADAQVWSVPTSGGPRTRLADGGPAHWGVNDTLVYSSRGSLYRVAPGGEPELLLERSDSSSFSRPHLLPNGRGVVFEAGIRNNRSGTLSEIAVYDLVRRETRVLPLRGSQPWYVPTGHLLYGRDDQVLMAVPFDLETLALTGDPVAVLPALDINGGGAAQYAVSDNGTLIYLAGTADDRATQLVEVGLDGRVTPLPLAAGPLSRPRYSPDGRMVAYEDGRDLRLYDVVSGASPLLTDETGGEYANWSATGEVVFFKAGPPSSAANPTRRPADRRSDAVRLVPHGSPLASRVFMHDIAAGDSLGIGHASDDLVNPDLYVIRFSGDSLSVEPLLTAAYDESNADISPDGRWLVYESKANDESRIAVHSFPQLTMRHDISPGLATDPMWSPSGDRIYYRSGTRFYAVDVRTQPTFTVGEPRLLFEEPRYVVDGLRGWTRSWDVHPDGDRFVMVIDATSDAEEAEARDAGRGTTEALLVVNWFTELRALMRR